MDDQIIVRINKEVKKEFADLVKKNGTDSSTLIREFIEKYIEENRSMSKEDLDSMWDLGQTLQKAIGIGNVFEHFKKLQSVPDKDFINNVMQLLAENEVRSPKILLESDKQPPLKISFFAGLIGEVKNDVAK